MEFLAISGSVRRDSTNTALLRTVVEIAAPADRMILFDGIGDLPIFSPDLEGDATPPAVTAFCDQVQRADAVIICSPEYVHAIPGGLKNAIDWLVSREEIVAKPMALLHASHRGEDMLRSLRLALRTVSGGFDENNFVSFPLMTKQPGEVRHIIMEPANCARVTGFIEELRNHVLQCRG
jgi:NAD(P)H-dependent FMN reductase